MTKPLNDPSVTPDTPERPEPPLLTESRVREIVREELANTQQPIRSAPDAPPTVSAAGVKRRRHPMAKRFQ